MAEDVKDKQSPEESNPEEVNEKSNENSVNEKESQKQTDDANDSKKEKKNKYKEQIAKLESDLATQHNEYLKVFAEMENTKKRLKDEAIKERKYASYKVVGDLINPIDMLCQIVNMPANNPDVANYQAGFKMIANQLIDILKTEGLAEIVALDKEFDPNKMHAVSTEDNPDKEDNIVVKVMQNGYMYKDRVLRPAMVIVNKKNIDKKEDK